MGIRSWFRQRFTDDGGPWLRRVVSPSGRPNPKLDEIKRAAMEDVAEMEEEDRKYFRHDGPGNYQDEL